VVVVLAIAPVGVLVLILPRLSATAAGEPGAAQTGRTAATVVTLPRTVPAAIGNTIGRVQVSRRTAPQGVALLSMPALSTWLTQLGEPRGQ
jgi:hypothetical protein